jgi:hypothetical protein
MVPFHIVNHARLGEKPAQPRSCQKYIPGCGKVATARLQGTVAAHQLHAQHPATRVGLHIGQSALQGFRLHKGIRVQQQHIITLHIFKQLIIGPAKTHVLGIDLQAHKRKLRT